MSAPASTSTAPTMNGPSTLRLHVWGSSSQVPTLDPTSLYAASLLHATFAHHSNLNIQLASASTSLSRVPLLQVLDDHNETIELLDNVESIRAYCTSSALDSSLTSDEQLAAKQTALHALLDDQLLDLSLHSLFSLPANYRTVTAPAYSSVGGAESSHSSSLAKLASLPMRFQPSIPSRLRNVVETRLTAIGLWGLGGKEASAKSGESDELAARAGIIPERKKGLGRGAKDAVRDEFERSKLVTRWREVLDVVDAALYDDGYLLGGKDAGSLDAHVFGYLAPLVFAQPKLPVDTLPRLVQTSYPRLAAYLSKVRDQLFSDTTWIAPTQALAHPPSRIDSAPTSSGLLSYIWPFGSSSEKASFVPTPPPTQPTRSPEARPRKPQPPTSSAEDRKLRWGRALWICSALVGFVGYTFASGIVSVKIIGPEDVVEEEEDEDEDAEDDADEEDEEDKWEVQSEDGLDDELDEMELDDEDEEEY